MEDAALYSSRITRNYVEYINKFYPGVDTDALLKYAGITSYQLEDGGHWLTQEQIDRFHEILSHTVNNPHISRDVGRHFTLSKASGVIPKYVLGFITPSSAYNMLESLFKRVTLATTIEVKKLGATKLEVTVRPKPGVKENKYQCENRMGTMESIAKIFTNKFADVTHTKCMHKGADCCVYEVSWEELPSVKGKRIRNYLNLASVFLGAGLYFVIPHHYWLILFLSVALCISAISLYFENISQSELSKIVKDQGEMARNLLDQINLSYNNALLVQEIGQACSSILDTEKLLKYVMETFEKRLDFDRGLIMLANRERTRLVYTAGYGYEDQLARLLSETEFNLENPRSRGEFVKAYREQKPFLVEDIGGHENDLSQKTKQFVQALGVKSFICVPIVYEGQPIGILAIDNIKTKKAFSQSDVSLLMGIANQIGISLNNATVYQRVQESEQRFRSLSENAPDIIYTVNDSGRFTYVNPAWERILDYKADDAIGQPFTSFMAGDTQTSFDEAWDQIKGKKRKKIKNNIYPIAHKDGSTRYFAMSGAPNLDALGNLIGLVGTLKDITDQKMSEEKLKLSYGKLQKALDSTIKAISLIIETRDPYTAGHQERVAKIACSIAREMQLSEDVITGINMAAQLHDIGKIYIPSEILSKPGSLNQIEMGMIKAHPEVGYNILKTIDFPYPVADMVLQHHEKLDGSGYPYGIKGEDICLEAKILAVADVLEAMSSHRPYRPALGMDKAIEELAGHRDLYDYDITQTCINLIKEDRLQL
ncbi:MAG: PAS domain S-box protein [Smithellaceae bacterium]|nr:PAS domain S-box protein [Smithellaceae bacterium]